MEQNLPGAEPEAEPRAKPGANLTFDELNLPCEPSCLNLVVPGHRVDVGTGMSFEDVSGSTLSFEDVSGST